MDNQQLLAKFREMEKDFNKIGFEYLDSLTPIAVSAMTKKLEPFIVIEKAFKKVIKMLEQNEKD